MTNIFSGAIAVITGGASGIGLSLAKALAKDGARVAIADISADRADAAAADIGASARGYRCDVSDRAAVLALAADIQHEFGDAQFVFANAGVFVLEKLHETRPADFDWLFDVNVRGVFNTIQSFAPQLLAQASRGKRCRMILTGSENSVGLPFEGIMTAYTATKHAILAMGDGLRRDLEGTGVGVTVLCPGPVNTDIWNARRVRQERYGGAEPAALEVEDAMNKVFTTFVHPDVTAHLCLEGVVRDEFLVITDPRIRAYADQRHAEVSAALDRLDTHLQRAAQ